MSKELQTAIATLAFRWALTDPDHRQLVGELLELVKQAQREAEDATLRTFDRALREREVSA